MSAAAGGPPGPLDPEPLAAAASDPDFPAPPEPSAQTPDLPDLICRFLGAPAPRRIGVAVSGGGDSLALLHALKIAGFQPEAVTLDHGLRAEAAEEARAVGQICAALDVPHQILHWPGTEASGNLMDGARRARLRLIGAWARGRGLDRVALGHTLDDQAETFLMRLGREAGLEGLSGMRPRFQAEGVEWLRPLLTVERAALRHWLRARDLQWFDDPSNDNDRFARVRVRQALPGLAGLGITATTLGAVSAHLASANAALERILADWAAAHVQVLQGELRIARAPFEALDAELARRLMRAALIWVAASDYGPRAAKLAAFLAAPRVTTLHGCQIRPGAEEIVVTREVQAVADVWSVPQAVGNAGAPLPGADGVPAISADWDGWRVSAPGGDPPDAGWPSGARVGALGGPGLLACPDWRDTGLSREGLLASPAVWLGEKLLAAPLAGLSGGWKAQNLRRAFLSAGFRR